MLSLGQPKIERFNLRDLLFPSVLGMDLRSAGLSHSLATFGAVEVSRKQYQRLLADAITQDADFGAIDRSPARE